MSRLPFDPGEVPGPEEEPVSKPARRERKTFRRVTEAEHLSVSELANLIKSTLEQRIPSPLRVVGQISNLSAQNHWYFSLKDEQAVVSCVAWASTAKKFKFTPKDGDEVLATGHVSHYPPQGRTQLYVTSLKPVGAGAMQLQFQAMCEELRKLGYFDPERKKPLPNFPRRIAVITSASGAAIQDVISTAAQRCRAVGILVIDVPVQGDGAAEDVARAIRWADQNHERLGVDAILVTRGGGSIEDLWAFNERVVADAAFGCSVPLVAAVGHESDTTVVELVADLRAATPTQAAMRLVPASDALEQQIAHLQQRLGFLLRRRLERERQRLEVLRRDISRTLRGRVSHDRARLEQIAARLAKLRPHALLAARHERLAVLSHRLDRAVLDRVAQRPYVATLGHRLDHAMSRHLRAIGRRLDAMSRELLAVDPRRVLQRGYSYTTDQHGELLRSVRDVHIHDPIVTHLADGSIDSVVGRANPRDRRPRRAADPTDQMDLFGTSE